MLGMLNVEADDKINDLFNQTGIEIQMFSEMCLEFLWWVVFRLNSIINTSLLY